MKREKKPYFFWRKYVLAVGTLRPTKKNDEINTNSEQRKVVTVFGLNGIGSDLVFRISLHRIHKAETIRSYEACVRCVYLCGARMGW